MPEERPLRIALFSDSYLPVLNGVSISIKSLVDELRRQNHSVHIYTAAHFKFRDSDPNVHRFFAVQTPWTRGYPLAVPPFYPMLRIFRRTQYDVVHAHTPWTIGFVGLRWAQSHDLATVGTYHTLYDKYAHYIPFAPKRYLRYKIAKHTNFFYNSLDEVITPSDASRRWLLRHSVKRPITVIPTANLVPQLLDRSALKAELGIHPEQRVLLYVGRIATEKNMFTLLEAAAISMRSHPSTILLIVGDGPSRTECKEYAFSLGIGDRVRFEGFVPREQVDRYYAVADIFCFASTTETQGLVVSEAMSYGLPAIVVSGGGAGAAIVHGENGLLVRNDAAILGEHILQVLSDDHLWTRLSDGAQKSARAYSPTEMANQVVEVYRKALARNQQRVRQCQEQGIQMSEKLNR